MDARELIDKCVRIPVVVTFSGRYVDIKDIKYLSRQQFKDEDGVINALTNTQPTGRVLWIKLYDDSIDAILLTDLHNMYICKEPADFLGGYQTSSPDVLKGEDLVEFKIVEVWNIYQTYGKKDTDDSSTTE